MALSGNTGGSASAGAIKAGEAFFEITGRDAEIRKLLAVNVERVKAFARTIQNVGIGAAGVGAAIFTPLAAVFKSSLDRAADTGKLATRLGTTTEILSSLGYAAEASGVQVEDWVKAAEKMQQAALQAAKGGTDQAAALELLGTNAQDFANMKLEDKFLLVAKAVEGINNPLEKQMLLSGLFGDEFGKLLPLFSKGREGIKALMAEASQVGAVINSDDARAAVEINKDLNRVWASAKNTVFELGLSVLNLGGNIKDGTSYILQYLQMIRDFIRSNREAIATVALIAAGVIAGGLALAAFGIALQGVIGAVTGLVAIGTTLIGIVFSPLALKIAVISALIAGLTYAFLTFTETGRQVKSEFISAWNDIKNAFTDAYTGIVNALMKGDLALAGEIAMAGLEVAWKAGLNFLTQQWVKFKKLIIDGWLEITDAVENMVLGFQVAFTFLSEGKEAAMKIGNELGKQLDDMKREDEKRRNEFRQNQLEEAKGNLEDAKKRLRELNEKAAIPKEKPAPNPIEEEAVRRRMAIQLGDSVKGTFASADFKGALGLGKANEAAKKQYEIAKQQLAVLNDINKKIVPGVFQ